MRTTIGLGGLLVALLALAGCGGWDHDHHGWGHAGWSERGGPCASSRREAWVDRALARAQDRLDVTTEQKPAWDRLAADVRTVVADTCAAATSGGEVEDAAAAFARLERVASTGAQGIERIRPAFDAFYAALDADQRKKLDRFFTRRFG
jgi:hypothetical protein